MKIAYILQPGKLGDLILSSPIANFYYEKGYTIKWFCFDNFINFFKQIPDVEIITFNKFLDNNLYMTNKRLDFSDYQSKSSSLEFFKEVKKYLEINLNKEDIFLDICWGFPGANPDNNSLIHKFHIQNKNWIDMRYFLAKTPLSYRWKFSWIRNEKKEDELLKFIQDFSQKKYGSKQYSISHNYKNNMKNVEMKNTINFSPIKGYEIYDWYKVLLEAKEISCVDSSLCHFVEVLQELKNKNKYYLGTEELHYFPYMRNILLNNWYDHNKKEIISDYKDKI